MLDTGAKTSSTAAVGRLSIHAPAWGATYTSAPSVARVGFQSTLPRGERPIRACNVSLTLGWLFQSTLPRGERLCACNVSLTLRAVSIHAPAWGAT